MGAKSHPHGLTPKHRSLTTTAERPQHTSCKSTMAHAGVYELNQNNGELANGAAMLQNLGVGGASIQIELNNINPGRFSRLL